MILIEPTISYEFLFRTIIRRSDLKTTIHYLSFAQLYNWSLLSYLRSHSVCVLKRCNNNDNDTGNNNFISHCKYRFEQKDMCSIAKCLAHFLQHDVQVNWNVANITMLTTISCRYSPCNEKSWSRNVLHLRIRMPLTNRIVTIITLALWSRRKTIMSTLSLAADWCAKLNSPRHTFDSG